MWDRTAHIADIKNKAKKQKRKIYTILFQFDNK